ncbi:2,3-diaminopropionate biosynthesis protein SbnB [Ktedonobacter sp. SOSP1-52]|uniref:ornithine cyclodeaminase family protein n=1 Tax=Ktedonobacter sp. SOSP1-52 TaxID=2778366 RepID=UPI001915E30C|nr:ornithine cyclodeaminase family protein [Ktedonobacter sp. SOSP1-52]GHO64166.1 2,3-diaminopropionate biosynthesis protein SbnB [Ktedonobacter sp. SOSP1-52]
MSVSEEHVLYLCQKVVEQICQRLDAIDIIATVLKLHSLGQTVLPDEAYLAWKNSSSENVRSLNMPAYIGGHYQIAGTKIINSNTSNSQHGLPRASGLTVLFNNTSIRACCLMESSYISSLRTACITAISAKAFCAREPHSIALIGAGAIAEAHIRLLAIHFPQLDSLYLFDQYPRRSRELVTRLKELLSAHQITPSLTQTAEEATRSAELIVTATTTTQGYIPFAWLQPGAVLVHVSLDDVLPEVVLQAQKVIVDDWNLVKSDSRRLIGRMYRARQVIGPNDSTPTAARRIDAELGAILTGEKPGRQEESDIILVNPFGLAIEDIALAKHVYDYALSHSLGVWLDR